MSRAKPDNLEPQHASNNSLKAIYRILVLIALMLGVNVLYVGRDLIMPLVFGLLVAMTLSPVIRSLARFKIPAPLASFFLIGIVGFLLVMGSYGLTSSISELMESVPTVKLKIEEKLLEFKEPIQAVREATGQLDSLVDSVAADDGSAISVQQQSILATAASTFAASATTFGIALFMALFLLSTGTLFHEKLLDLMRDVPEKKRALRIVSDIENQVSQYLLTITLINAGLGIVIALFMGILNVPNPILWGIAAMCLNFLPFVGAMIGAFAMLLVSLTTFDSLGLAIIAPVVYYICSLIEGSFITPMVIGHRMSLNIVAVFLSVTAWGWLWGMPGVLMAVPILVAVKVICDNIGQWAAFGHFLTGRVDWKPEQIPKIA